MRRDRRRSTSRSAVTHGVLIGGYSTIYLNFTKQNQTPLGAYRALSNLSDKCEFRVDALRLPMPFAPRSESGLPGPCKQAKPSSSAQAQNLNFEPQPALALEVFQNERCRLRPCRQLPHAHTPFCFREAASDDQRERGSPQSAPEARPWIPRRSVVHDCYMTVISEAQLTSPASGGLAGASSIDTVASSSSGLLLASAMWSGTGAATGS